MAGNSVIGALRVDLGLNSAQFTSGLKTASAGLNKFGIQLTLSLETIANAVGRLIGAFPGAIKAAVDHADALSKAAQKAGVSTEALSRLAYAASFSEVSLDDVTSSLGKLSKTMADAAQNTKGTAATAFAALGIAVKDSAGHLRDSDQVFLDVADRFSRLDDGATKTAISMALFGKSGANLIPVLNEGAAGLKRFFEQSDKIGQTISTKTANAANHFNDTLTDVGATMDGVINKIIGSDGFLDSLDRIASTLSDPKIADAAVGLADTVVSALDSITSAVGGVIGAFTSLDQKLAALGGLDKINDILKLTNPIGLAQATFGLGQAALTPPAAANSSGSPDDRNHGLSIRVNGGSTDPMDISKFTSPAKTALKDWNDAVDGTITRNQELSKSIGDSLTSAVQDFVGAIMKGTNPLQAFGDELANIGQQLLNGGIQSLISSIFSPNYIGGTLGAPALKLGFQTGIPGFASGTMSAPAGLAWVGENGPELVNFGGGESVSSHSASMAAMGGSGRTVVQLDLGPNLVAQILQQASDNSVQIVRAGASTAVATDQRNKKK